MENPTEYALTDTERSLMESINGHIFGAKLEVYELNVKLEAATRKVRDAEYRFSGALAMLAEAHGMTGARLTSDMKSLTKG